MADCLGLRIALEAVHALGGSARRLYARGVLLAPQADWRAAVTAHAEVFATVDPANTTYYVHSFIPDGVLVEVEIDAVKDTDVS